MDSNKYDLSVLIPARNEMFTAKTVEDILEKAQSNIEVIVVLDGGKAGPEITPDPRVTVITNFEAKGQRAATNQAARVAQGKYVMKCDAHCGFDEGFDVKILEDMQDDWTVAPVMRNLHAFDWLCTICGWRTYQGRTPIKCGWKQDRGKDWEKIEGQGCDSENSLVKDMKWIGKNNPQSDSYTFDSEPHFQYFKNYRSRPEYKKMKEETGWTYSMSLQGSFFLLTREKYWELNICDEEFGSWGSQGIEVAVKTWLSGGKVMICHKTWYAHMFRSQGGDFGFPYPQKDRKIQEAKAYAREQFYQQKFKGKYTLRWLLDKFAPLDGWTQEEIEQIK